MPALHPARVRTPFKCARLPRLLPRPGCRSRRRARPWGAEWLEADGLGGFASGPVLGPRTRRYHALLLTATTPPTGRIVQVNGIEAWIETEAGTVSLSTNLYLPDVLHPAGWQQLTAFEAAPWPSWTFRVSPEATVRQEILVARDSCETVLRWRLSGAGPTCRLHVRPLLSGGTTTRCIVRMAPSISRRAANPAM